MSFVPGETCKVLQLFAHPLPLLNKPCPIARKRQRKNLSEDCGGSMETLAEGDPHCKFIAPAQVNFSHHGNIAMFGPVKFPIHFEVSMEVLLAITLAHKTAGAPEKTTIAAQRHVGAFLPAEQDLPSGNLHLHG